MKVKTIFAILIVVSMLITSVTFAQVTEGNVDSADDGPLFSRNVSRTPHQMTGASQQTIMPLYVTAQNTQGDAVALEYLAGDCTNLEPSGCTSVLEMTEAKPLFATYNDGVGEVDLGTGAGFGERDVFAALSLDDGATWKNWNLSDSALRSSFVLKNGHAYPGDVFKVMHAVEGNRIAVAYISRYCESGAPLYSWTDEEKGTVEPAAGLLGDYPELANPVTVIGEAEPYELYMDDLFGVAGAQQSVDYTLQGFPEVGEIPYGCVWVDRGTLEEVDTDVYEIVWRASERLTSGRRDANRVEITSAPGAGFIVSWQEDPAGLRPGKGLGPGEGWSGAIANAKTDIWYSYIAWDHFDDVTDGTNTYMDPTAAELAAFAEKPKIVVPFAVPVRLTDNNKCEDVETAVGTYQPYCFADFDGDSVADLCETSDYWVNPNNEKQLLICITQDGRHLTGRTASTRVRWALKPYTQDDGDTPDDKSDDIVSAWVVMGEEKMKAMGTELSDPLDPDSVIDIGKDMWYHTFDMFEPELVQQGLMLNSPAIDHETMPPALFPVYTDEWGDEYYETEIARRFNLMVQGVGTAMNTPSRTSAILIYKEGILNQGGPADIFTRRVVVPETVIDAVTNAVRDFDPSVDNPFAYENVVCDAFDGAITPAAGEWLYTDGLNPNYVKGLCMVQGMNMSGTTIIDCIDSSSDDCAADFPWDALAEDEDYPKVTEWRQCDGLVDNTTIPDCEVGESTLDDPSWANPYDVSKGHRGFIDGDFVMMMYATAPNWKANTVGNESYNLYIRRSFDGGQTWTTLPDDYVHWDWDEITTLASLGVTADGTYHCEDYGWGGGNSDTLEEPTCTTYGAGEFEQARNVSRLVGTRITVLDPRYSPTGGMRKTDYSNLICDDDNDGVWENCRYTKADAVDDLAQELRDPTMYFVTYETGDNTVVTVETGTVPLDMYYSRAENFGDDYGVVEFTTTSGQLVERWDWLENGAELATEASVYGNPDGSKFYAVWNQELPIGDEVYTNMDSEFRRIFYNDDTEEDGAIDVFPSSSILYVSTDRADYDDEEIVLIGTARDHDNLGEGDGISNYRWWVDATGHEYNERVWKAPPNGFIPGKHDFSFAAQDNEGNWSRPKTVTIWIAEQFYDTYLPLVTR